MDTSYVTTFRPQWRQTFRRRIRPSRSGSVCVVKKCRQPQFGHSMPRIGGCLESDFIPVASAASRRNLFGRVSPGRRHLQFPQAPRLELTRRRRSRQGSRTSDCRLVRAAFSIRLPFGHGLRFLRGTRKSNVQRSSDADRRFRQTATSSPDLPWAPPIGRERMTSNSWCHKRHGERRVFP